MVILYFGDIFGKPGRRAVARVLPDLLQRHQPDFILGNVENLAGGRGVTKKTLYELFDLGFSGFTSGNHIWDNKEVYGILETEERLLRPANYPSPVGDPCPGKGFTILKNGDKSLMVINLMGRVFMDALDCPFQTVDRILTENRVSFPVFVDMHADATSEKSAMAWFLAGRVSAVVGSHSHVQTADERVLPGGTAFITDVGMTGAFDSCIGLRPPEILRKFLTKRPQHTQQAVENPGVGCVVIKVGDDRQAESIERLRILVSLLGIETERDLE